MIEIIEEIELADFPFWAGARNVAEEINHNEEAQACWEYLEEVINSEGRTWTAREINDFIWFDAYDELVEAGYFENEDQRGAFGLLLFLPAAPGAAAEFLCTALQEKVKRFFRKFLKNIFSCNYVDFVE